jgi:hypothetical protein
MYKPGRRGPSQGLIEWLGWLIEVSVCLILLVAMAVLAVQARHHVLAGPAAIALGTTVVAIVRYRWRSP